MPLFQNTIVKKYVQSIDKSTLDAAYNKYNAYFHNATIQNNIKEAKEEQFQEGFLRELFGNILGYTLNPNPNYNLTTELKNISNSKKVDGAIIFNEKAVAVIELKGTDTTDLAKIETQAFGYKNNQPECIYVITSNFEKLRFYIDNAIDFIEFNLFNLSKEDFAVLYVCLSISSIQNNLPKNIKDESVSKENNITNQLYKDYSEFKRALFNNIVEQNPQYDKLLLFKKTQKLLDRFLFIFFAEDRLLLPTNLIRRINLEWDNLQKMRIPVSLYERYKVYFNDLNAGANVTLPAFGKKTGDAIEANFQIFAYNGGLFQADDVLDALQINDVLLYEHTHKLSDYNFESEVDVNILGHIFENSLNEIDEIKTELEGGVLDKTKTKRKKDGVFYTPKYITKYIVENTIGKLCTEKKEAIQLNEADYSYDKKKTAKKESLEKLDSYRNWLLQLTICDPACGSGAFLNQALEFLIAEHRYLDELKAKVLGDSLVLSDIENSILENNLYGVDLNDESTEIAKLSLWLRTARRNRKLNSLTNNIKCGNSLIDDPAVAGDKAFNWEKEFPQVFAKGGFDVVIGNPPYVSHERIDNKEYLKNKYNSFSAFGDLYVLFYELSHFAIKKNGICSLITSNSFLKAEYGKQLRSLLKENSVIEQVINIENTQIFSEATVNTVILTFSKSEKNTNKIALIVNDEFLGNDFDLFVKNSCYEYLQSDFDDLSWNLIKPIVLKTRNKIKGINKTLEEYDTKIRLGLATGDNDAFIIDEEKRNNFISANNKNGEIIKPLLRGRDIDRFYYTFPNLYLLLTKNGINVESQYPDIYNYLESFGENFKNRGAKGQHWTNLRACSFFEDFKEEKIIWIELTDNGRFTLCDEEFYLLNSAYFLIPPKEFSSRFLLSVLNSRIIKFYLKQIANTSGVGTLRWINNYVKEFPIPLVTNDNQQPFIEKADLMLSLNKDLQTITSKFTTYFSSQYNIEKLSNKLEKWYELEFVDFIKEINKAIKAVKGNALTKKDEYEWIELFEENKQKALALKTHIDQTDKEIDQMVYALYELTEEEIKIVEGA